MISSSYRRPRVIIAALSLACVGAMVGCKNQNNGSTMNGRAGAMELSASPVTPVAAAAPAPQAYAPVPAPASVAQPVVYDTVPAGASASSSSPTAVAASTSGAPSATSGGSYTVKKGDTLYSIAIAHYGSGKAYTKIVSANPGLSADRLKVGQKIVLP